MNRGQAFLLFLIGVLAALSLLIVLPFLEYVIAAIILAYVLLPFHRRLEPRAGGLVSAVSLIVAALVALIVPLVYIGFVLVRDLNAIARGETDLDLDAIETRASELLGREVELSELFMTVGQLLIEVLFGDVTGIVTIGLHASLGIALVVFLGYYLLREGPEFVAWARRTSPLPDRISDQLIRQIDVTTWGVVVGHISVAVLQAIVAGFGLWLVGIPDVVFWTFVMAILALLPLIGAFMVWGPAAAYLVVVDQATAGVLLAVYGIAIVSMVDNYVRPILIDQQAHINPGVILVGVFGGIYSIGFTGLFVGPIVIGVLVATLETFREEYDEI